MLAAQARAAVVDLERIVDGRLRLEEIPHGEDEPRHELLQEKRSCRLIELHRSLSPLRSAEPNCSFIPRPPGPKDSRRSERLPRSRAGTSAETRRSGADSRPS